MRDILGLEPGQYLITDPSSLHDFIGVDNMKIPHMFARIGTVYGLDFGDLPNGHLLEIFRRVRDQQIRVRRDWRTHSPCPARMPIARSSPWRN